MPRGATLKPEQTVGEGGGLGEGERRGSGPDCTESRVRVQSVGHGSYESSDSVQGLHFGLQSVYEALVMEIGY